MRICFLCLGNICRSPTAEGVTRMLAARAGRSDLVLDSAGTGAWHAGELPDPRTREAARSRGIELTHRARQLVPADLDSFDLIVAMDLANLRYVEAMRGARTAPALRLFRAFDPTAPEHAEIPDPYAGGRDGFEIVLDQCERAAAGLLAQLPAPRGG